MAHYICFLFLLVATCSGSPRTSSRILGGADADIKDVPFAASIEWLDFGHACSASIVDAEWVLTDAWCTYRPDVTQFTVRVGSVIASNESFVADTGTVHNVTEWIFHQLADVSAHEYDFALVKVTPPFEFNANVSAAALPALGQETPEGAVGVVAGWGQKDGNTASQPPVTHLQYANISLASDTDCASLLMLYNERILCGQGANGYVALCWHDEGGPLVVEGTLFGISLWPVICGDPQELQKFGRVASVRDWIDSTIGA